MSPKTVNLPADLVKAALRFLPDTMRQTIENCADPVLFALTKRDLAWAIVENRANLTGRHAAILPPVLPQVLQQETEEIMERILLIKDLEAEIACMKQSFLHVVDCAYDQMIDDERRCLDDLPDDLEPLPLS